MINLADRQPLPCITHVQYVLISKVVVSTPIKATIWFFILLCFRFIGKLYFLCIEQYLRCLVDQMLDFYSIVALSRYPIQISISWNRDFIQAYTKLVFHEGEWDNINAHKQMTSKGFVSLNYILQQKRKYYKNHIP